MKVFVATKKQFDETDFLFLKDVQYACHLGITAQEQSFLQTIFVDMKLFIKTTPAALSDKIEDTINYAFIYEKVREAISGKEFSLIETVAETIAQTILVCGLKKVIICVKKPCALKAAVHASVTIHRKQNNAA